MIVVPMIDWDINDECLGHAPGEVASIKLSSQYSSGCLKPFSLSPKPYVSLPPCGSGSVRIDDVLCNTRIS